MRVVRAARMKRNKQRFSDFDDVAGFHLENLWYCPSALCGLECYGSG